MTGSSRAYTPLLLAEGHCCRPVESKYIAQIRIHNPPTGCLLHLTIVEPSPGRYAIDGRSRSRAYPEIEALQPLFSCQDKCALRLIALCVCRTRNSNSWFRL